MAGDSQADSKLRSSLGEILSGKTEKDQGAILNLSTGNLQVSHEGPFDGAMGIHNNSTSFAPRFGVAYQYDSKTVVRAGYGRSFDIGVFGSIFGHAVTQNLPVLARQDTSSSGVGYAFQLGSTPPSPNFGAPQVNGLIRLPDQIAANARPTTERFPTLDAWNAQVQREIGHGYNVTVGYVGNKGTHTFAGEGPTTDPNQVAVVQNGLAYNPAPSPVNGIPIFQPNPNAVCIGAPLPNNPCSGPGDFRRKRYFPIYGWTQSISYFGSEADTHYNSFQMTLDKRFSQGYQFKVNYAYQVAKNYDGNYLNIDRRTTYGNQDDLRQNQVTFFGNLELPFGRNHAFLGDSKLADYALGGWEISPTMNLASGLPFSVGYDNCISNTDSGPCRPNYKGGFKMSLGKFDPVRKQISFFAPQNLGNVFTDPGFLHFGNEQRNQFFGPGFFNVDVAAQKSIPVYESVNVVFRTDFFNVFNHQNFGNPGNTSVANPGVNTSASSQGFITGLAAGAGSSQGFGSPRYIQFALKVNF